MKNVIRKNRLFLERSLMHCVCMCVQIRSHEYSNSQNYFAKQVFFIYFDGVNWNTREHRTWYPWKLNYSKILATTLPITITIELCHFWDTYSCVAFVQNHALVLLWLIFSPFTLHHTSSSQSAVCPLANPSIAFVALRSIIIHPHTGCIRWPMKRLGELYEGH